MNKNRLGKIIGRCLAPILVVAILVASFIPLAIPKSVYAAGWYDSDWLYRKSVTVTNASANYQSKLTVYYGSGTDNNTAVYCSNLFNIG